MLLSQPSKRSVLAYAGALEGHLGDLVESASRRDGGGVLDAAAVIRAELDAIESRCLCPVTVGPAALEPEPPPSGDGFSLGPDLAWLASLPSSL